MAQEPAGRYGSVWTEARGYAACGHLPAYAGRIYGLRPQVPVAGGGSGSAWRVAATRRLSKAVSCHRTPKQLHSRRELVEHAPACGGACSALECVDVSALWLRRRVAGPGQVDTHEVSAEVESLWRVAARRGWERAPGLTRFRGCAVAADQCVADRQRGRRTCGAPRWGPELFLFPRRCGGREVFGKEIMCRDGAASRVRVSPDAAERVHWCGAEGDHGCAGCGLKREASAAVRVEVAVAHLGGGLDLGAVMPLIEGREQYPVRRIRDRLVPERTKPLPRTWNGCSQLAVMRSTTLCIFASASATVKTRFTYRTKV